MGSRRQTKLMTSRLTSSSTVIDCRLLTALRPLDSLVDCLVLMATSPSPVHARSLLMTTQKRWLAGLVVTLPVYPYCWRKLCFYWKLIWRGFVFIAYVWSITWHTWVKNCVYCSPRRNFETGNGHEIDYSRHFVSYLSTLRLSGPRTSLKESLRNWGTIWSVVITRHLDW